MPTPVKLTRLIYYGQVLTGSTTSVKMVLETIGNPEGVVIKEGIFPETASGLENNTFAFVLLDLDLYVPTLAGLEFFYPRMAPGGYVFVHDYNNSESNWACSRALNEFLNDKMEKMVEIPDVWGSAVFRKA